LTHTVDTDGLCVLFVVVLHVVGSSDNGSVSWALSWHW